MPGCEEPPPNIAKYRLYPGDIVVSRAGSVGFSYLIDDSCPQDAIFASYLVRIRPQDAMMRPDLLQYFMRSPQYWRQVNDAAVGVGLANVNGSKLASMQVPVPPRELQDQLAQVLDVTLKRSKSASGHLAATRLAIERFRQSVLATACSGFITAEWRNEHDVPAAQAALDRLRVHQSTSHGRRSVQPPDVAHLDALPDTWAWAAVGEVSEVQLGGTPSRKAPGYWGGEIPWVSSGEVANCRITSTRETISDQGLTNSNAKIYPAGTVLIAMIGEGKTRGQSAILDIKASTNQNVAGILPDSSLLSAEYVWRWALAQYEITRAVGRGGNQPALNGQKVRELAIPIPPLEEQLEIVRRIDGLLASADVLLARIDTARRRVARSTQATLANAFRGDISLNEVAAERAQDSSGRP